MILAAADCAEGKGPPPPELELAWQAKQWNALPEPGGLRDQRVGELARMSAALNTYNAVRLWCFTTEQLRFPERHPDAWEIVSCIIGLRRRLRDE